MSLINKFNPLLSSGIQKVPDDTGNGSNILCDDGTFKPIGYFDATVGTGGDYPSSGITDDINTAVANGKLRLKLISNITLTQNITINNRVIIDCNGYNISLGSFRFINSGGSLEIVSKGLVSTFNFSYSSGFLVFGSFNKYNLEVSGIIFNNTSTANFAKVATAGVFMGCKFILTAHQSCSLGDSTSPFSGICANSEFQNTVDAIVMSSNVYLGEDSVFMNNIFSGVGGGMTSRGKVMNIICTHTSGFHLAADNCDHLENNSTGTIAIHGGKIYNDIDFNTIYASTNFATILINNSSCNSSLSLSRAYTLDIRFNNVTFAGSITDGGGGVVTQSYDNCTINGNYTGTKSNYHFNKTTITGDFTYGGSYLTMEGKTVIGGNIFITGANNTISAIYSGNITISGTAGSTKITARLATTKTLTIAAGAINCQIDIYADSSNSVLGSDGLPAIPGSSNCDISNVISVTNLT